MSLIRRRKEGNRGRYVFLDRPGRGTGGGSCDSHYPSGEARYPCSAGSGKSGKLPAVPRPGPRRETSGARGSEKTVKPKPVFRGPLGPALIAFGFDDPAGFITLFTCQPMRTGSLGAFTPITGALPDIGFPSPGSSVQPPGSVTGERTRTGLILNSPIRQKRPRNRETPCSQNTLLTL